jgi:hypothetical protein
MLAHEIAEPYPYVFTDDDAADAALLLAEHKLPALLVVDRDDQPYAVVPGSQLVGRLVPEYALQDPPPAPGSTTGTSTKYLTGSSGSRSQWGSPRSSEAESGGGCRAAGSGRRRSAPTPVSCTSQLSWRARTPRWSPSSSATATRPGWSAR